MNSILEKALLRIENGIGTDEAISNYLSAYYDVYIREKEKACDRFGELELADPLEERESGVSEGLKRLLEAGFDPNAGEVFNPLMMAVGWSDAPMTKYLIENGADANYWPGMDEEPECMRYNFYLEEIDIAFLHGDHNHDESNVDALLQIAVVLISCGNTGGFLGFCLKADPEKREVSVSGFEPKY